MTIGEVVSEADIWRELVTPKLVGLSRLDTMADKVRQVDEHLDAIAHDGDRLLAVRFPDAIAGAPCGR